MLNLGAEPNDAKIGRFKRKNDDCLNEASLRHLLGLLTPTIRKHKLRLMFGFTALLAVDFLQLIIPRFIESCIDGLAFSQGSKSHLTQIGWFIIAIGTCVFALRFVWRYLIIGFSRILEKNLRNKIFEHILKMDRSFFERRTNGDLLTLSSRDLDAVQIACGMGMVSFVDAIVMFFTAICFMVLIDLKLTLLALLPMPFLALGTRALSGSLQKRFNLVQEKYSHIVEFARSTFVSIKMIKSFNLEQFQNNKFEQLGNKYVKLNLKAAFIQGCLMPTATLVGNASMLLVVYYGGILVIKNMITLGEFTAFLIYLFMLVWPISAIGWVVNIAQRGIASLRRVYLLLQEKAVVNTNAANMSLPVSSVTIKCRNLSFSYSSATRCAIDDISLDFKPGIHGIAGRTGSGKSTLCHLLVRLYPVAENCLFFNQQDVNQINTDVLKSNIAFVEQEPQLFSATVAENIAFGRTDYIMDEIIHAAKAASVHNEIMRFHEQYQTIIGERGVKLSGGQKQRIALARALFSRRPMLVIDDALSALDVETVQHVLYNLKTMFAGKTIIMISHRLNVLRAADNIVILENGRVIVKGQYKDLSTNSLFQTMIEKRHINA